MNRIHHVSWIIVLGAALLVWLVAPRASVADPIGPAHIIPVCTATFAGCPPPLQPVGVGPMWDMSVIGPLSGDWENGYQFNQHGQQAVRINVPTPTTDFQFGIAYTDNTPNVADTCSSDMPPVCTGGDFGSYWANVDECLTSDEAQRISYAFLLQQGPPDYGAPCTDADQMPGQWYSLALGPTQQLIGSGADPNSSYLGSQAQRHRAGPGGTVTDTLTTEAKLPKISNVIRFRLTIALGDSRASCGPNSFSCGICPGEGTSSPQCDNGFVQVKQTNSAPVDVVVIPAAAIQLRLLPYTILYAPPGSKSSSDFKTTSTFSTVLTTGQDTGIDTSTTHDSWLKQGEKDQANLAVSLGAEGIGITDKATYDFSQSVRWDNSTTSTTGQSQNPQTENGVSVSTTFGESVGPGGNGDASQVPGQAGSYANAPFLNDRIVALRHPQLAVWDFDGKPAVQMIGARGTPQGVDWVTLVVSDLGACAQGQLQLNIAPPNEQPEILTPDECQALASLDPFYGIGQAADLSARGGQPIIQDFYGMPASANPNSQPDAINLQDVTKFWNKATQTNKVTYGSTVMSIEATDSSSGLTLSGDVKGGEGSDSIDLGLSQGFSLESGETDTGHATMAITYTNSTATTTEQDWTIDGTISDTHTNLVDPSTNQPYRPYVVVYQDLDFGGFMYQDPGAPCLSGRCCKSVLCREIAHLSSSVSLSGVETTPGSFQTAPIPSGLSFPTPTPTLPLESNSVTQNLVSGITNLAGSTTAPLADLTVSRASPDAAGEDRFTVANIGIADAGPFRIAVAAGAQSFSINATGLAAGQQITYTIPGLSCGQAALVTVDADNQVQESNKQNNEMGFSASCAIDTGAQGVPGSLTAPTSTATP